MPPLLLLETTTTEKTPVAPELASALVTLAPSTTTTTAATTTTTAGLEPTTIQWAQSTLPPETLAQIITTLDATAATDAVTTRPGNNIVSPQTRALQWLQSDPLFAEVSSSTTTITTRNNGTPARLLLLVDRLLTRFGLATLYYATQGDQWSPRQSTGWLSTSHECSWPGYRCEDDDDDDDDDMMTTTNRNHRRAQVTRPPSSSSTPIPKIDQNTTTMLQLGNLPVMGTLPLEIALLTSLRVLEVYPSDGAAAGLQGSLPSELGRLTNLMLLDLHNNQLTGTVPTELGLLTSLEALYLYNNSWAAANSSNMVPTEVCELSQALVLVTILIDCHQVVACDCGCQCPTTSGNNNNNIFDHDTAAPTLRPSSTLDMPQNDTVLVGNMTQGSGMNASNSNDDVLLCNGLANICNVPLPEVLFAMVHNAMASESDGFILSNHLLPLEEAVQSGYRGINLDVCSCGGQLVLCHGLCSLGTREIVPVFQNLYHFLLDNPHEVLQISLEFGAGDGGEVDIFELYSLMETVGANFTNMLYVHESPEEEAPWPTLRSLIETNKVW